MRAQSQGILGSSGDRCGARVGQDGTGGITRQKRGGAGRHTQGEGHQHKAKKDASSENFMVYFSGFF